MKDLTLVCVSRFSAIRARLGRRFGRLDLAVLATKDVTLCVSFLSRAFRTLDENLRKYREGLIDSLRFMNEVYDKLLLALSGGALGLSIAFLKDVVALEDTNYRTFLLLAWVSFVVSLSSVLGRLLFGIEAYRTAIKQVDNNTIYSDRTGGRSALVSRVFHWVSAAFLVLGLLLLVCFAFFNLGGQYAFGER